MDHPPLSPSWLTQWCDQIAEAVDAMLVDFEDAYGYTPGANGIREANADDLRAARDYGHEALGFSDMATFYASIGDVSLPDVGNGCFIHSARHVLNQLAEEGPVFIPESDDPLGMVIASDGGGLLFVADWCGAIHRSSTASVDCGEFHRVAENLPEFLDLIRRSVLRFTGTGEVGHL
ncbi:hypothetical protein [Streptomyces beijiangensis]|uniref:SMI1/KNR4 family protein n=1 Tax=Streptomyces beijiangensis TaxID=163361 RepID=A0A939FI14_9ACTN|nr:hypothetical protein [Streptomyces beijiangensis]MBO0517515.1 hypothetical protein [Streptomyces beijiangensis]